MKRLFGLLLLLVLSSANAATKESGVLFVGNSLTYVNNLPALFAALAAGQPGRPAYRADLIAAPGGSIAERWQEGIVAGEIATGRWQVLVLQERGGVLACLARPERRSEPDCVASLGAHRKFAALARQRGVRVLVLGTWGPDSIWQAQLSRGLRKLAQSIGAEAVDAGPPVRAYARSHPQTTMYGDASLHPSLDASLLMAAELLRHIDGETPRVAALATSAPLLPVRAAILPDRLLSRQPQVAGDGSITRIEAGRLQPLIEALAADRGSSADE